MSASTAYPPRPSRLPNFLHPPLPREHGAWAMFLAPLVVGIGAGRVFDANAILVTLTAFGFFLLRFPLMLALKTRAPDARSHALVWSAIYAAFTGALGCALVLSTQLWALVLLGTLGGVTLGVYLALAARRAEMSVVGEWIGIAGLCLGAPAAYLVTTRRLDATALALYGLNVLYFGGTVLYIKFKVREQPHLAPQSVREKLWTGRLSIAYHALVCVIIAFGVTMRWLPALTLAAFALPMCKVIGGALTRPARLNIRRLGFIEVGFTLAFLVIAVLAYW